MEKPLKEFTAENAGDASVSRKTMGIFNREQLYTRKLVVFGASVAFEVFANKYGLKVGAESDFLFVCDNDKNKQGRQLFKDVEVVSPERIKNYKSDEIAIIITSSFNYEIIPQLTEMGYFDSIIFTHEVPMAMIERNKHYIQTVYDMLEDEKSKNVYERIIDKRRLNYGWEREYRRSEYTDISELCFNQYFAKGIFTFTEEEVFVDAGAYDGDTIRQFLLETNSRFKKIYAFEPLRYNYKKLQMYVEDHGLSEKIKLIRKGVSSSGVISESNADFEVCSIDDSTDRDATFIKMDIEGYEISALNGARETIIKNKPKLAICIYHKTSDYWQIPLLIKSFVPEYKFFVRQHGFDTVLYAT